MEKKSLWETWTPKMKQSMTGFCEEYKQFMSQCKTERECVDEMIAMAQAAGYKNLFDCVKTGEKLTAGSKVYANNRNKMLVLVQVGKKDLSEGLNILGAHIDSPRLDLKPNPLYEDSGFAMLKTHYYGGIKKFQWVTMPLALHGVVAKKDGTVVKVAIGEEAGDPVFGISDILPHLAKDQRSKNINEAFTGEDLNITFGSTPAEAGSSEGEDKDLFKKNVLNILNEKYGITEEDFQSAEIEVVPAGAALFSCFAKAGARCAASICAVAMYCGAARPFFCDFNAGNAAVF